MLIKTCENVFKSINGFLKLQYRLKDLDGTKTFFVSVIELQVGRVKARDVLFIVSIVT